MPWLKYRLGIQRHKVPALPVVPVLPVLPALFALLVFVTDSFIDFSICFCIACSIVGRLFHHGGHYRTNTSKSQRGRLKFLLAGIQKSYSRIGQEISVSSGKRPFQNGIPGNQLVIRRT